LGRELRTVAKPAWGIKRICHSCGIRFYDLLRDPIVCPSCGARFQHEVLLKARNSRVTSEREQPVRMPDDEAAEEAEVVQEEPTEEGEEENEEALDEDEAAEDEKEEETEDLIEDASELGGDEDDMTEVIDQVDPEEER